MSVEGLGGVGFGRGEEVGLLDLLPVKTFEKGQCFFDWEGTVVQFT